MVNKISFRYRSLIFALLMSATTALIVSGIVTYLQAPAGRSLTAKWMKGFLTAWPIVFTLILIFVPFINKFLNLIVEEQ